MDNDGILYHLAATATVHPTQGRVTTVAIAAGADAASVILKDGGASGTTKITLKAPAGETAFISFRGANFATDIHATITGTAPAVMVEVV